MASCIQYPYSRIACKAAATLSNMPCRFASTRTRALPITRNPYIVRAIFRALDSSISTTSALDACASVMTAASPLSNIVLSSRSSGVLGYQGSQYLREQSPDQYLQRGVPSRLGILKLGANLVRIPYYTGSTKTVTFEQKCHP